MKEKGFTLIELLAVIIILAIISLIATPIILEVIDDSRKSAGLSESNIILNSINNYCEQEKYLDNKEKICVNKVIDNNIDKMVNLGNAEVLEFEYKGELTWLKVKSNHNIYSLQNGKMVEGDLYKPNEPELFNKLIPIKYDGVKWIYADINYKWYDYEKKEWANAVVVNNDIQLKIDNKEIKPGDEIKEEYIDLWYVWIPRYKYQIFNPTEKAIKPEQINIRFENQLNTTGNVICNDEISGEGAKVSEICTNATIGNWYTHPAFTFGKGQENAKEVTGIWMGKFEIEGNLKNLKTKPGLYTLSGPNIKTFSDAVQNLDEKYSILNADSHMMKNMEWGVIAYLSHSKYGTCNDYKCIEVTSNDSSLSGGNNYKININQSTTQNVYGIYDLSGGKHEFALGNTVDANGNNNFRNSGFAEKLDKRYVDIYSYNWSSGRRHLGKLGDATKETLVWYNDHERFPYPDNPWFIRGGAVGYKKASGLFHINYTSGSGGMTARIGLVNVSND